MAENIEVELRGRLDSEQYKKLTDIFSEEGKFLQEKKRVFIDYSTFLEGEGVRERQRDIRIRNTNGESEIMIKLGGWGGNEHREELSVPTNASFDTLAKAMNALGYRKGVLCVRYTKAYTYKNIEFALVEVPSHSYYFEAEKMVASDHDMESAKQEIRTVCGELGLEVFSDEALYSYIETLNKEANGIWK